MDQTNFQYNNALISGGAIYISHFEDGIIKNSDFINNDADNGGCVFIYKKEIEFDNCKFMMNRGKLGTVFYIRKRGFLELNNSELERNSGINGTCFYVEEASDLNGQNNKFERNVAELGSIAYMPDSGNNMTFRNSEYVKNTETVRDGLVYEVNEGSNEIVLYGV